MSPIRPRLLLPGACLALALGAPVWAQDGGDAEETEEATERVEDVVEERAEEEASDGEPSDADVGEASYNVEDCSDADGGDDADAAGDVAEGDIDECEPVEK